MNDTCHKFPSHDQASFTAELHETIADHEKKLQSPWLGMLPFQIDAYGDGNYAQYDNILDLMQNAALSGYIMRFCPIKYPPTQPEGVDMLVRDIFLVAREHGVELVTGGGNRPPICKSLVCSCSLLVKEYGKDKEADKENVAYRVESLHNDRKNNRPNGHRSMPRRCSTKRRLTSEDPKCTFRLNIYKDATTFYLKVGSGCPFHSHHAVRDTNSIRLPSRFVHKDAVELLCDGKQACIPSNAARNLFFIRSGGEILSKSQVATITGRADTLPDNFSTDDIKESLQNFFQSEKAEVCFLYHKKTAAVLHSSADVASLSVDGGLNEFHHLGIPQPLIEPALPSNTTEAEAMHQYANINRHAQGIQDTQDVFLGVAWVLPAEKRLFNLFPYVVHMDGVEDTNNEKRTLFTATGRDANGNMFTILRAFLPNQCAWVFRWLFQSVFPRMFGVNLLNRIVMVVTDGDSQETSQLDIAMKQFFPQAFRGRCIWHIVKRGMDKYFPKPLCRKHANHELYLKWESVKLDIQNWIWSWSDSRCETEEEFKLSKALFIKYMASHKVQEALGQQGVEQLHEFYCKRIEPHEDLFVFYRRCHLFHFDTNSNSAHEGTNHGIKYHSLAVKPTHGIVESTKILTQQSKLKCRDSKVQNAQYSQSKVRGWSNLPTANSLTRLGESILLRQWEESTKYVITAVPHDNKWFTLRRSCEEIAIPSTDKYPVFRRVRMICRDEVTGVLKCSCFHFERIGICCRHVLAVLRLVYGDTFQGITETSIRVFWWSRYSHYGTSNLEEHQTMLNLLLQLRDNDVSGPVVPANVLRTIFSPVNDINDPILELSQKSLADRCRNFSVHQCNSAIQDRALENNAPSTLSQDYWNFNESEDDEQICAGGQQKRKLTERKVFEKLNPVFKSLVSTIESTEATVEDIEEAFQDMLKLEAKFKERFSRKSRVKSSSSNFVSSNLADNPRRKTHGTKHMQ